MPRGYTGGFVTGLVISGILAVFGPVWLPVVSRRGRPAAKAAIRGGMSAYDAGRTRIAELREALEDLIAEAEVERVTDKLQDVPPSPAAAREARAESAAAS